MLNCNWIKKRLSLKLLLKEDSSLLQVLSACKRNSRRGVEGELEGRGQRDS